MSKDNDISELLKFMEGVPDYSFFPEIAHERLVTLKILVAENQKMKFDLNLIAQGLEPISYIYNNTPRLTEGSEYMVRDCLNIARQYNESNE